MKKLTYLVIALMGMFLVSCGGSDDPTPAPVLKGKFAIDIIETASSTDVEPAYAFESVTTAVITIEKDGIVMDVFNNKELSLNHIEDYCESQEIELDAEAGYSLTKLQLKNAEGTVTFATPITGSELASAVAESLPISFEIITDLIKKLELEVICTQENDVTQFGYASFNVTDKTE